MKNKGTLVGAAIRPNDSLDKYPVAFQSEIKGGHHTRDNIQARNSMGMWLREAGMTCYVAADGNTYELAADLITWTLLKGANGGSTGPGSGGDSSTVTIISGNFGLWLPVDNYNANIVEQLELCYKTDLQAFPSRAITHLQGQFSLDEDFAGTAITLGNLPENNRPVAQLKKYFITSNIEMFLVIETNGDVKLSSKDGFSLPAGIADQPFYIDTFFKPVIIPVAAQTFTATRTESFGRNDCGLGYHGSPVSFTKTYTSTVDQATADYLAASDTNFSTQGQAFANDVANGSTCEVNTDGGEFSLFNYWDYAVKYNLKDMVTNQTRIGFVPAGASIKLTVSDETSYRLTLNLIVPSSLPTDFVHVVVDVSGTVFHYDYADPIIQEALGLPLVVKVSRDYSPDFPEAS